MVQLVECLLAKEKVTGSNPVARSEHYIAATWPSWQGKGLQNPHHEFESRRRLLVLDKEWIGQKRQKWRFFHSQDSEAGCWLRSAMMVSSRVIISGNCSGVIFARKIW